MAIREAMAPWRTWRYQRSLRLPWEVHGYCRVVPCRVRRSGYPMRRVTYALRPAWEVRPSTTWFQESWSTNAQDEWVYTQLLPL